VLEAMDFGPEIAQGAVRLSLGWSTSSADIDRCLEAGESSPIPYFKELRRKQLERF